MRKGTTCAKYDFLPFFKLSPFQGLKSPRLLTWFVSSLGLLLHVRSCHKPPIPSDGSPKWGIKNLTAVFAYDNTPARPAHTGSGRGLKLLEGWWKNIRARFEVHSCYGSRDPSTLKWKFGKCAVVPFLIFCHISQLECVQLHTVKQYVQSGLFQ